MKLGDLVIYLDTRPGVDQLGLIIDGPKQRYDDPYTGNQWEVFWMYCNTAGWWDEHQMEVICEAR